MGRLSGEPVLRWEWGTGYDLFASLFILHQKGHTGVRRSWAAGVRNRLNPLSREALQRAVPAIGVPFHWLRDLGPHPEADAAVTELGRMPPEEALLTTINPVIGRHPCARGIAAHGSYCDDDVDEITSSLQAELSSRTIERCEVAEHLSLLAEAETLGREVVAGLREYHDRFFREEVERIRPLVSAEVERAMEMSGSMDVVQLVEELSGGLEMTGLKEASTIVLVGAFWAGPLVLYDTLADGTPVIVFSARPRTVSLIPGEPVPETLILSLQAVSDPTRLRILRLLGQSALTQAELARQLRLRPPTITHHLQLLRLANLIRLTEPANGEKRYGVRPSRLGGIMEELQGFLTSLPGADSPRTGTPRS